MSTTTRRKPAKRGAAPIFTTAQVAEIEVKARRDLTAIQAVTEELKCLKPRRISDRRDGACRAR